MQVGPFESEKITLPAPGAPITIWGIAGHTNRIRHFRLQIHNLLEKSVQEQVEPLSYFEIAFAVLEHFWWRKRCQKRGGKWNCNRRREAIIGSQVQEIMPKGA